jgi:hypothetical protein
VPHDEDEIRRLLADARHTEPMPDDVVARVDRVLADLRRNERRRRTPTPVDLAAARRRRRARGLLVAAAAVVVVGIGIDRIDLTTAGSDDSASTADSGADSEAGSVGAADGGGRDGGRDLATQPQQAHDDAPGPSGTQELARMATVRLSSDDFGAGVRQARREVVADTVAARAYASSSQALRRGLDQLDGGSVVCSFGDWGRGRFVPARYGGALGVLAFRRPRGETQVVDLFLCGGDEPTRSITLPAP